MRALVSAFFIFVVAGSALGRDLNEDLHAAAKAGDVKKVEALLARGADVNAKTAYGATALHFAADKGHLAVVRVLIQHKANVNARDTFYSANPLTWASMRNRWDVIQALADGGADGAEALLNNAVKEGQAGVVRAILARGKVKGDSLNNALAAVPANKPEIAAILKKAGAKLPEKKAPAAPAPTLDAQALKAYEGAYVSNGIDLTVVAKNGQLRVEYAGNPMMTLKAVDKNTFKAVENEAATISFERQGDKVVSFTTKVAGASQTFKRMESKKEETERKVLPLDNKPVVVKSVQNWPSFRGRYASGVADGQMPPVSWDVEKGYNVRWKTPIPGLGHSCPVVWDDKIFLTTAISSDPKSLFKPGQYGDVDSVDDKTVHTWKVFCADKRSGRILWERTACQGVPKVKRHTKASHANPTPATDGQHVIACFGSEGLYCYDATGTLLWKRDLGVLNSGWFYDPDYQWGFASSPVLYKNEVIVQCDIGKNSFVAAYDLDDGRLLWQTPREEVPSWGTPTIYEGKKRAELITNATKFIRGYDPLTGKELWRLGRNSEVTVGTPVTGNEIFFVTGGYPPIRPVYAVKAGANGDISLPKGKTTSEFVAWSDQKNGTYMPTPIVYGDCLYTCNNSGLFTCYEVKTGKQVFQKRVSGRGGYTASPVAADGRIYLTSEDGEVRVVKAGPGGEILTTNYVGDTCMATPAISDGMIFYRTQHYLIGIGRVETARAAR
jgi:outer membrane protein assembly factor BamB